MDGKIQTFQHTRVRRVKCSSRTNFGEVASWSWLCCTKVERWGEWERVFGVMGVLGGSRYAGGRRRRPRRWRKYETTEKVTWCKWHEKIIDLSFDLEVIFTWNCNIVQVRQDENSSAISISISNIITFFFFDRHLCTCRYNLEEIWFKLLSQKICLWFTSTD